MIKIEYKQCSCGGKVVKLTADLVVCEKCYRRYWAVMMIKPINRRKGEKVNV
jgi:hypothetical protein